jgi:hypothetical protein
VPRGTENLLVAGRCISVSTYAHGATRNMAPCMTTGEAAGIAAALSAQDDVACPELSIGKLQDALLATGVYLGEPLEQRRAA